MDALAQLNSALADRYQIEREIGAGGMATVYLARDVRHQRLVALKVLNPELGAVLGVERFLSEIRVTANLQHPNLLPLFDSGSADGLLFYVMPFVDGETLRHRLEREKQLPIDEAIRIASAIASALAYAHERGVIHRDLKPENILIQAGQPVIADFGIALAVSNAGGARITQTGLSLGTPQYMSPEQATGDRVIDGRADIYSLGAILYEMLTGEPPHTGNTAQAVIARVLTEKPRSVRATRPNVPEHVELAVMRALEKLPADRWSSAKEFADALQTGVGVATTGGRAGAAGSSAIAPRLRKQLPWIAAVVLLSALALAGWLRAPRRSDDRVVRYVLRMSPGTDLYAPVSGLTSAMAFSPDGKYVVYNARRHGERTALHLHSMDRLESRVLPGTEGGIFPAFSPNGKWLAFVSGDGKLMKMSVDGGTPTSIVDPGARLTHFAWVSDKTIVFDKTSDVLWRVSADGGPPARLPVPAGAKRGEYAPVPVGDDDHVLYANAPGSGLDNRLGVLSLKSGKDTVFESLAGAFPLGVLDGQLLFVRIDGSVMAAPFDLKTLRVGAPVQIGDSIDVQIRNAAIALSPLGDLAFVHGGGPRQLVAVDERGVARPLSDQLKGYANPRLSPDGRRLAFEDARPTGTDIWEYDLGAHTFTKLTAGGVNDRPEWSRDGTYLLYSSNRDAKPGSFSPWKQQSDGSAPAERIYDGSESIREVIATPDGRSFVLRADATVTQRDIFFLEAGSKKLGPLVAGPADELTPRVSPDGRWLAYVSDESGQQEVYVRPLRSGTGRIAVSGGGGTEPLWSRDGKHLFYRRVSQLVEATLTTSPSLALAGRRTLFDGNFLGGPFHANYDVMPDGKSFVMVKPADEDRQLVIALNWRAELRRRVAGK